MFFARGVSQFYFTKILVFNTQLCRDICQKSKSRNGKLLALFLNVTIFRKFCSIRTHRAYIFHGTSYTLLSVNNSQQLLSRLPPCMIEITGPIPASSDVFANVIGRLTLHPAVDCRRWWSRRAAPRAPILWWESRWRRFRRRTPETDERPRWLGWTSPETSDLAPVFPPVWKV